MDGGRGIDAIEGSENDDYLIRGRPQDDVIRGDSGDNESYKTGSTP